VDPINTMATPAQEAERAESLRFAQNAAESLFDEIARSIIRPGVSEKAMTNEIYALGLARYNIKNYWHQRVVRCGPNTLYPYKVRDLPDRVIAEDDILFVDLGPVFEDWEADFGRTFVLGADPVKIALRDALAPIWNKVKARFDADQDVTGAQLFEIAKAEIKAAGYEHGGLHAGHIVGNYPHEQIPRDKVTLYITDGNDQKMRSIGKKGVMRHWILEIHLVDRERQIGGFFEQLLTVD